MILSLLIVILILAIMYLQATHGLYSALIMMVLTICCAALAIGMHEQVAIAYLVSNWKPDFAYAISLAALFGIPLVILRLALDKLIRRSCLLPLWVDRIGGGFCGLITSLVVVGILTHAISNLPFGGSILGFARVPLPKRIATDDYKPVPPEVNTETKDFWFKPDRFVIAVTSLLSAKAFSGSRPFYASHPDPVTTTSWTNAVPPDVSRFAPPNSISIVRTSPVPFVYELTAKSRQPRIHKKVDPPTGKEFWMIRVKLKNEARDSRRAHVFTLRQFNLVGEVSGARSYKPYYPMAIQEDDATQSVNRHILSKWTQFGQWPVINNLYSPRDDHKEEVEIVFELPTGFEPAYLEYKRGARVAVSFDEAAQNDDTASTGVDSSARTVAATVSPPTEAPDSGGSSRRSRRGRQTSSADGGTVPNSGRGGRVRGVTTRAGQSKFGDELPVAMKDYQSLNNLDLSRGKLTDGHIVGELDKQDGGTNRAISRFDVPGDKRLLQLNTDRLHTQSGLGKLLDHAATTVQNYFVTDASGSRYEIIGKYAIADVEGTRMVEIQYFSGQAGTIGGLGKFQKIKDQDLKQNYELVLLFLVDPGVTIASFSTGGSATRKDDLTGENLVAPQ